MDLALAITTSSAPYRLSTAARTLLPPSVLSRRDDGTQRLRPAVRSGRRHLCPRLRVYGSRSSCTRSGRRQMRSARPMPIPLPVINTRRVSLGRYRRLAASTQLACPLGLIRFPTIDASCPKRSSATLLRAGRTTRPCILVPWRTELQHPSTSARDALFCRRLPSRRHPVVPRSYRWRRRLAANSQIEITPRLVPFSTSAHAHLSSATYARRSGMATRDWTRRGSTTWQQYSAFCTAIRPGAIPSPMPERPYRISRCMPMGGPRLRPLRLTSRQASSSGT
jgi:hypothetical protein